MNESHAARVKGQTVCTVALALKSQAGRLARSSLMQEATELAWRASTRLLRMWPFY